MPELTLPLSVRRWCYRRTRDAETGFGQQKSKSLRSLSDSNLKWVATWANLVVETLKECSYGSIRSTILPSNWTSAYEDEQPLRGVAGIREPVKGLTAASWTDGLCFDQSSDETVYFETFTSLVRSCGKTKSLSPGRQVHTRIIHSGYDHDTFLGNCLVQMYGNCGNVEDARAVFDRLPSPNLFSWNIVVNAYGQNGSLEDAWSLFDRMPSRDVVAWNAMITACARHKYEKEALALFEYMHFEGVTPNNITFVSALDACSSLVALEDGQEIHTAIVCRRSEQDVIVGNALINMYGKCSQVQDARSVFCRMHYRNVVSWTTMIATLGQNGEGKEALAVFHLMQMKGIDPDTITCVCALDACANVAAHEEGQQIHITIIGNGAEQDVILSSALINMYGKCGNVHDARSVFAKMRLRNVVCWTAMIAALAQNSHGKEALDLFHQMECQGVYANNITFAFVVDACTSLPSLAEGQGIHAAIVGRGHEEDIAVATALVNMYGKCGTVDDAMSVFCKMPHRNIISWSTMIAAFAQNGFPKEALSVFQQMQSDGLKPNYLTFACLIDACARLAALEEGRAIHAAIADNGFVEDVVMGNAFINMYGKCGSLDDAKAVFAQMPSRNVISWTAMIAAFAYNGHGKDAVALFLQMQLKDIKPDSITLTCVLTACSHTGLVEDGRQFFLSMYQDHGIMYTMDHYVCMVDLLGRAGHLDEAEDLIMNIPFEDVTAPWQCLLGACTSHGDVERALRVGNRCFELDPKNVAPYVILANIFAASGKLDDMADIQVLIEEN